MHKCKNHSTGNVYHLEQMVGDFFPYSQQKLGFDRDVTIVFKSDKPNSSKMLGKTAYYDPGAAEVVLYVDGRHPKDIMRSLSHELVHHTQNCRGDFTDSQETPEGYAQKDPHLRKMEREAYTKGNLIFRDYEDLIKTGKKEVDIDFSKSGDAKMSLKEWKNNEINTKLMKKWGFLKESKEELYEEAGHPGQSCKEAHPDEPHPVAEGWGYRDEDDEGWGKDPAAFTGTAEEEEEAGDALKRGGAVEETTSRKISVREAKQITRRIMERVRKEGR